MIIIIIILSIYFKDICIYEDYTQNLACDDITATKFYCPSLYEKCTIKTNHCDIFNYSTACK